jgi:hypothetical protein
MSKSREIGRYIGPVLVLLFVSEIINLHIWSNGNPPQLNYLNGFVLLLFGWYIVSKHNIWTRSWPILITLAGWFATLLGLYRMFFPDAPQASDSPATIISLTILLVIALFLTYKSYKPKKEPN